MVYNVSLCATRHEIPEATDGSVFGEEISSKDMICPDYLEELADRSIRKITHGKQAGLHIYVTGLTVALIAAIKAAKAQGHEVTLFHYDRETGGYYRQNVW